MQTIEITGHIYAQRNAWDNSLNYTFFTFDGMEEHGYLYVCPHKIVAEVPDSFNPVAAEVAALEKERENVRAELNARIKQINDRIANLTCIEHTPVQEAA
ncbi:hypothetical protein C7416_104439 [Cupriavidus phytorum]|uniref:Uncharacterized protein n=1 Tax=Cupriavidus phytorum TaxID=3024399 RepID=A0A2W7NZZ9_9BURK|nr:hypothetical protein [Cupriavidus alkaliphilus]PZX29434.1 hypothetical protein C7416_104439 [Cupriavidus alkaliphilus]